MTTGYRLPTTRLGLETPVLAILEGLVALLGIGGGLGLGLGSGLGRELGLGLGLGLG